MSEPLVERALRESRWIVAGMAVSVAVVTAAALRIDAVASPVLWPVSTTALFGILSPVLGYRLYGWVRERAAAAGLAEKCRAFVRAHALALGLSEGCALLGLVAFVLSRHPAALLGVATHAVLCGALWPGRERLEGYLGDAAR
ncbi:MAG TPA: hypothetical protein VJS92_00920 [Candidatus Polarisedimenticolaceae bacterium]|nr:hypothetical protein [Candidatus Polarisedimenticolaceae bacterium]